ncbi:MAG: branched-chain-amino-acid transaminase [Candidatus Omnitrophica bacterium]|nr:branched-chain-amino-acid transaminase [Candidatus Omnitrophota bacterium]
MGMKIYLNGSFVDAKDANISVFDHGLLYGDGVFEGIRSYSGLVFKLKEHIDRLYVSAEAIRLKIPLTHKEMIGLVVKTLKVNKLKDAYIRLVVTRGEGDLGLDPRKCHGKPSIFIIADKITLYPKDFYKNGLDIITAKTRRNLPQALDPRIKSLNYLNNILAKIEATDAGVQEAIMLTHDGFVTECTGDNIFIVKRKTLMTPPVVVGALEGITRSAVMTIARRLRVQCKEKRLTLLDLYDADECFLTGTAAEIIPVVAIDRKAIGTGKPGPVTQLLLPEFKKITTVEGIKVE